MQDGVKGFEGSRDGANRVRIVKLVADQMVLDPSGISGQNALNPGPICAKVVCMENPRWLSGIILKKFTPAKIVVVQLV